MPAKIIVAFSTRLVDGLPIPAFTAPSNWKDEAKIKRHIEDKQAEYTALAKDQPYTGTFDCVQVTDISKGQTATWNYEGREPGGAKQAICLAVKAWLLNRYESAWPHTTHVPYRVPEAIFIGFNPRLFLKMLGTDCSLPQNQPQKEGEPDPNKSNCLPLSMWITNTDHRDLGNLVMPSDYKLDWNVVLSARGLREKYPDWNGPFGTTVQEDMEIAIEMASQLGLVDDDPLFDEKE